jgi:hypothetical protein
MLLSLLIEDREFLGMQPTDPGKLWKAAILWTDPGSDDEYADRIYPHVPDGTDDRVVMRHVGITTSSSEWEALTECLLAEGVNIVVLDNLTGATGDPNSVPAATAVFDGLTRLTNWGIPVVIIHHESEHGYSRAGAEPMGASVIVQKSRTWIQVRQTARRKLRGGNTALIIRGNALGQPQQLVAEPLAGPNYRVIIKEPWVDEDDRPKREDKPGNKPKRSRPTDQDVAEWIIENCQGKGVTRVKSELATRFPHRAEDTWRDQLIRGSLSKLLTRGGEADNTSWS